MSKEYHHVRDLVAAIEACNFECEAGPLSLCVPWQKLKKAISEGPKYALGSAVWYHVTAEACGVKVHQWVRFTVVGCLMGSDADGRAWEYTLSTDPPAAYHYGTIAMRGVQERDLLPCKPEEPGA